MTTLAADKIRQYGVGDYNEIGVIADDIIYRGAAVGDDGNGFAQPLEAGDGFLGFANEKADNTGGSAGDKKVKLKKEGWVVLSITDLAADDIRKAVYASDDDTFTLDPTGNSHIGRVVRFISAGVGLVYFNASRGSFGDITPLTNSTGSTANDTLEDCNNAVTGVDGSGNNAASKTDVDTRLVAISNNISDLGEKINEILAMIL